jgi:hypothetical protein
METADISAQSGAGPRGNAAGAIREEALRFSTFFGGAGREEFYGVAADRHGNLYVTGYTESPDLPVKNAFQGKFGGGSDALVAKWSPSGELLWATYLGGEDMDAGYAVAVDGEGNAYVTGYTSSIDFPMKNPFQKKYGGVKDAFVSKFSPSGDLLYSTYLGGLDLELGYGIAVDREGNVWVTGYTGSINFPTKNPFQGKPGEGWKAFVTKLSPAGDLLFSSLLGGDGLDEGYGIAVDREGNAVVVGLTGSTDFPTKHAAQGKVGGGWDGFLTKISPSGRIVYSTYLGGSARDDAYAVGVDGQGNAYVTGWTFSPDFPLKDPWQKRHGGGKQDAFVAKLSPSGRLLYATFLGGGGTDLGRGIAVDEEGQAFVTGLTESANFPTLSPLQANNAGRWDAYVVELSPSGRLLYATHLGGGGMDMGRGVALPGKGRIAAAGRTGSSDFPTKAAFQQKLAGVRDAFLASWRIP